MKLYLIPSLIIIIGCSSKEPKGDNKVIEKSITGFVKWYSNNWDSLAIKLIEPMLENSMVIPNDTMKAYSINFKKAEIYLSVFKQSGFVSDKYIESYREYFKKCQKSFEMEPQTMGPAAGFDYDFIYKTQDYRFQVENADKATVKEIKVIGDKAIAMLWFSENTYYAFKLSRQADKWLIDEIGAGWMPTGFTQ